MKFLYSFLLCTLLGLLVSQNVYALKITEIYPAPSSGEQEWVEVYNDEETIIDLSAYSLTDAKDNKLEFEVANASPSSYILATGTNILNNNGPESVNLKHGSDTLETISYTDSFSSTMSYIYCSDNPGWIVSTVQKKRL